MPSILQQAQNILQSPSKKIAVLDLLICVFFAASCYSIPTCSFLPQLNIVTWALSAVFMLLMACKLMIVNRRFEFTLVSLAMLLFAAVTIISSLLNGFVNFSFTALLLSLATLLIYSFCNENRYLISKIVISFYLATVLFLITFVVTYFRQLVQFDFDRLGSEFGNVNDVAIFLGLGGVLSIYYVFYNKNIFLRIINVFLSIIFVFAGLSTGTKILLFAFIISLITVVVVYFGKERWYYSLILILGLCILVVLLLLIPVFSTFRNRIISMVVTFFGGESGSGVYTDYSSINRFYMFLNGIEMMLRKPLFGYGFHGFHNFSSFGKAWSHNNFSETLACFGLVGSVFYFFPFVYSIYSIFKYKEMVTNRNLFFLILIFFFVTMFTFAFDVQKLYSYLIGVVYSACIRKKPLVSVNLKQFVFKKERRK